MTFSDAFAVGSTAADVAAAPAAPKEKARPHARMRARDTSLRRVTHGFKVMRADLLDSWWTPQSLPTVKRAWGKRIPDREGGPGKNVFL